MLTALPTVGRRDPTKTAGLGPVRPTVGSTVGITTSFSSRYPISIKGPSQRGDSAGPRVRQSLWWVLQGYVAQKNPPPPKDPTVSLCLGTYGDPRGVGVSREGDTPVPVSLGLTDYSQVDTLQRVIQTRQLWNEKLPGPTRLQPSL